VLHAPGFRNCLPVAKQGGDGADVWDVCRSGLGLYLVQQALSSMGSSINASSELGRGSSFCFELPLADSECESESELETDMFSEAGRWGHKTAVSLEACVAAGPACCRRPALRSVAWAQPLVHGSAQQLAGKLPYLLQLRTWSSCESGAMCYCWLLLLLLLLSLHVLCCCSLRASLELDYDGSTSRAAPRGLYGSDTSQVRACNAVYVLQELCTLRGSLQLLRLIVQHTFTREILHLALACLDTGAAPVTSMSGRQPD
jgi:hypothetical protein